MLMLVIELKGTTIVHTTTMNSYQHSQPSAFSYEWNLVLLTYIKSVAFLKLNRYNNKTYRIDDVAFDQNPRCTFPFHNGEQMSYVDYYKYGGNTFIYPKLPLLSTVMGHSNVDPKMSLMGSF